MLSVERRLCPTLSASTVWKTMPFQAVPYFFFHSEGGGGQQNKCGHRYHLLPSTTHTDQSDDSFLGVERVLP